MKLADFLNNLKNNIYNITFKLTFHLKQLFCPKQKNSIKVVGDSHCNFFSGNEQISFRDIGYGISNCSDKIDEFSTFRVGPALAYSLNKFGTKTKAREKIGYLVQRKILNKKAVVIFTFGEIDIRVHVLSQAKKQNTTYKIVVDKILDNYLEFLLYMKKCVHKIYVWGPIPTQKDGSLINPDYPYFGKEIDRNKATEYFNQKLKKICQDNDIGFLSIFDKLIDENYVTRSEYIADGCHLSQKAWKFANDEIMRIKD